VSLFPVAVYAIVALNVAVFAYEAVVPHLDALIAAFAMIPFDVTHGVVLAAPSPPSPYLTLVTSQFFHAGFTHVFFNMAFLIVFGPDVEFLCGPIRFVLLYLACGIVGNLAQISVAPGSHVPTIGASGAIAGILGAYIVTFPHNKLRQLLPVASIPVVADIPAFLVIGVWAIAQVFSGYGVLSPTATDSAGGVAYFAHIGGFLAGVFLIGVARVRPAAARRFRYYY